MMSVTYKFHDGTKVLTLAEAKELMDSRGEYEEIVQMEPFSENLPMVNESQE